MKKLLLIGIISVFAVSSISAQEYYVSSNTKKAETVVGENSTNFAEKGKSYIGLEYMMSFPMSSDLESYINNNSFTGGYMSYSYFISNNMSVGGSIGYQYFTQKLENAVAEAEDGFIKGTQFRHASFVPVLLNANYHFVNNDKFTAFVGVGAGVAFSSKSTEISKYLYKSSSTDFMIKPQLGLMYRVFDNVYLNLNVDYNYIMSSEYIGNIGYLGTSMGIVIR